MKGDLSGPDPSSPALTLSLVEECAMFQVDGSHGSSRRSGRRMESVHELVALQASAPEPHLVLVQDRGQPAEIEMVRCPSCNGLRPVSKR